MVGWPVSAWRNALVAAVLLTPAACSSLAAQEQPAVVAAHTKQSLEELTRVASAASNGQPVTVADDALTRVSVLTLERRTPPGPQGRAATGRTLEMPTRLSLVLRGTRCFLVRDSDGREWELSEARCVPAPAGAR
jgi:hypothetical protein